MLMVVTWGRWASTWAISAVTDSALRGTSSTEIRDWVLIIADQSPKRAFPRGRVSLVEVAPVEWQARGMRQAMRAAATAGAVMLVLTGCGPQEAVTPSEGALTHEPIPGDIRDIGDKRWGQRVVSDRGNLVKEPGQWAGWGPDKGHAPYAVFQVAQIDPDLRCTAEAAQPAVNGRYVGLTFEVETTPQLADNTRLPVFVLEPEQFQALGPDGGPTGQLVGNARTCLREGEYLPEAIEPDSQERGIVVLDVPEGTTAVVLDGRGFQTTAGWEWQLPPVNVHRSSGPSHRSATSTDQPLRAA